MGAEEVILKIQVIQGRGLAPKDSNGLSDPYVIARVNNKKSQTKTINKTLNPVWQETLEFNLRDENFPQFVQIVCWDADFITRDFMGQITIHMKDLFDNKTGMPLQFEAFKNRQWYRLQKKTHKDIVTGELELNIGFEHKGKSNEFWNRLFFSFGGRISPPPDAEDD
ncbi:C2-domain-containing protein [Neoconidiobolus thromboides FSU 785]|nr:C2-domain-containing protein [Neoconidiobolus thromboides FSU 785]